MASWEIISQRRSRGCGRRHRAAFERYESPIELYRPWADGCVRVPADFGREFQVRLGREEARVDVSALSKQPDVCNDHIFRDSRPRSRQVRKKRQGGGNRERCHVFLFHIMHMYNPEQIIQPRATICAT